MAEIWADRLVKSVNALDRCQELGLEPEHLRHLASECQLSNYQPPRKRQPYREELNPTGNPF